MPARGSGTLPRQRAGRPRYKDRSKATGNLANTSPSGSRFPWSAARDRTLSPVRTLTHSEGAFLGSSSALSAQTFSPVGNRPGGTSLVTNLGTAVTAQARFERLTNANTFSCLGPVACKRLIGAIEVQVAVSPAEGEGSGSHEEFDAPVLPMVKQVLDEVQTMLLLLLLELGKQADAPLGNRPARGYRDQPV